MTDPKDPLYFPEDERSPPEQEDDHSYTDFDLQPEIESRLGPAEEDPLAASREACQTYQRLLQEPKSNQLDPAACAVAARNVDAIEVDDDCRTPLDGEQDTEEVGHGLVMCPQSSSFVDVGVDVGVDAGTAADKAEFPTATEVLYGLAAAVPLAEGAAPVAPAAEDDAGSNNSGDGAGAPPDDPDDDSDHSDEEDDDDDDEEEEEGEEDSDDRPMTLRDHLTELRKRLTRSFLIVLVGFVVCWPIAESHIFPFLFEPLMRFMPEGSTLIFTSPPEAFFTYMKIAFVSGIFLTSPLVFYQFWAFIAPGLYKEEKLYILPVALASALFFILGAAFCYYVVFDFIFDFFMSYNKEGFVQAMLKLNESLSFALKLLLAFGLVFQLPLVIFFLARLGIVTADKLRSFRRYAIFLSFIVSALLTPPDVLSLFLMAGPVMLLYEISILIVAVFGKKKKEEPASEEDDDEEDEEDEEEEEKEDAAAARRDG
jgi:sec-independent protein translocase protein TatC